MMAQLIDCHGNTNIKHKYAVAMVLVIKPQFAAHNNEKQVESPCTTVPLFQRDLRGMRED